MAGCFDALASFGVVACLAVRPCFRAWPCFAVRWAALLPRAAWACEAVVRRVARGLWWAFVWLLAFDAFAAWAGLRGAWVDTRTMPRDGRSSAAVLPLPCLACWLRLRRPALLPGVPPVMPSRLPGLFRATSSAFASGALGSSWTASRMSAGLLISSARFRRCWRCAGVIRPCPASVCRRAVQAGFRATGCRICAVAVLRVATPGCWPVGVLAMADSAIRHSGALSSFSVQCG